MQLKISAQPIEKLFPKEDEQAFLLYQIIARSTKQTTENQ